MHIKKFTGRSAKEAMNAVKAEFGRDALIMSSKKTPAGIHEIVAAIDYDLSSPLTVNPAEELKKPAASSGGHGGQGQDAKKASSSDVQAKEREISVELRKEIKELKEVKELFQMVITRSNAPVAKLYERIEEELAGNGIDRRLARKILMNAFNGVSRNRAGDEMTLRSYMKEKIFEKIRVSDPLEKKAVVTFVGPAGVGKTTTIAKLAAIQALKKKRRVALLTMDTYRIAAAEQLKVYGRIIGVPVEVAKNAGELARHISSHRDKDLILIDTAGRSQRNRAHMEEVAAIGRISPEIKFNLVLSAQTRDEGLYDCVRSYGANSIDSLTFTKLDEGRVYGPILNTMLLARKPVAYLTNGQNVPDDIEAATKQRLVNFFMPN